jgi:hypothetical protein
MGLTVAQVRRAAAAAHRSPRAVRRDLAANVDAGAALLARAAGGRRPTGLRGWRAALARVGAGRAFADQVYAALAHGARARGIALRAHHGLAGARPAQTVPGEEPGTVWVPASPANFTAANRPYDYRIDKIVIHETEGSYASTVSWFQNPKAQASAAFVVRSSDGAITQMVHEHDIAWHAGNWAYNTTSIGIEHEGYVGDCTWNTDAMYRSSAELVAYLAARYAIPVDRAHIIGHSEVPDPNHPGEYGGSDHHTDPGSCWNWDLYLGYIRQDLATISPATLSLGAPAPGEAGYSQIVDNGTAGRFKASKAWKKTRAGRPYFGGARISAPVARADAARFKLDVPTTGDYTVYARWPASRANSWKVPVAIATTTGTRFVHVNERQHGNRWRRLGTFQMPAGDGWDVLFSRWTKVRGMVVADGVRLVAAP